MMKRWVASILCIMALATVGAKRFSVALTGTDATRVRASAAIAAPQRTELVSDADVPLVVDGEKNPELIPDAVAYRQFILAVSPARHAAPLEIERRKRFVAALPLTAEDINVIESTVSRVNDNLDTLSRASAANRDAETEAFVVERKAQRDSVFDTARQRLLAGLSADGVGKVHAVVQAMKRNIKIYGSLPQ